MLCGLPVKPWLITTPMLGPLPVKPLAYGEGSGRVFIMTPRLLKLAALLSVMSPSCHCSGHFSLE
jgi:hypothetical protein